MTKSLRQILNDYELRELTIYKNEHFYIELSTNVDDDIEFYGEYNMDYFLMKCKETLGIEPKEVYNKIKVENILNSKPTKEQIFNSVILDKSYYEKSCKQQIELIKKQEKERNKLKPTDELYKMKFDI